MTDGITFIIVDSFEEPSKRRYWVKGPYATRALAYDDLAPTVRGLIYDDELTINDYAALGDEIARTGDGSLYGFTIHLADGLVPHATEGTPR